MSDLNDPRVFFAAERTLMAWTRTAVALMAFGFAIERFGLFLHMFLLAQGDYARRNGSFWVGASFILFGVVVACFPCFSMEVSLRLSSRLKFQKATGSI